MNKELFLAILTFLNNGKKIDQTSLQTAFPKANKKLWYMKEKGYIRKLGISYAITLKGKRVLSEDAIWNLIIPTPKSWDGNWHLVLFDIPADKRKRRDIFRLRLKELGVGAIPKFCVGISLPT